MTGPWVEGEALTPSRLNLHMGSASSVGGFSTNTLNAESGNTLTIVGSRVSMSGSVFMGGSLDVTGPVPGSAATGHVVIGGGQVWMGGNQFNVSSNTAGMPFEFVNRVAGGGFDSYVSGGGTLAQRLTDLGQALYRAGSSDLPSVAFSSESSLGFYRSAASTLMLSYGTFQASNVSIGRGVWGTVDGTFQVAPVSGSTGLLVDASGVTLTRSAANNLYLFGGSGVTTRTAQGAICIHNASGSPDPADSVPAAGGVLFCRGGALLFKGGSGSLTTIAVP